MSIVAIRIHRHTKNHFRFFFGIFEKKESIFTPNGSFRTKQMKAVGILLWQNVQHVKNLIREKSAMSMCALHVFHFLNLKYLRSIELTYQLIYV